MFPLKPIRVYEIIKEKKVKLKDGEFNMLNFLANYVGANFTQLFYQFFIRPDEKRITHILKMMHTVGLSIIVVISVWLFVCPIINQEPRNRFVSNFDWRTR